MRQGTTPQMTTQKAAAGTTLPFWDDFSYPGQQPDTLLWLKASTASRTNGIAINPPSWGTITLDGVQANGLPYSSGTSNTTGDTDWLQSQPIDLSALSDAEKASTYLSFYWQLQGAGERPDLRDSLKLYFLDSANMWHLVWNQTGTASTDPTLFQQQLLSLQETGQALDANFFHPAFSFKFQTYSRQNGLFDQWHLDYVYLNTNRPPNDIYYKDVAISSGFASLLTPYTAMPYQQFFANPSAYLQAELPVTAFNFEDPDNPISEDQVLYQVVVRTEQDEPIYTSEVITLTSSTSTGPVPIKGQEYLTRSVSGLPAASLEPFRGRESLTLRVLQDLDAEDGEPRYLSNNTILVENQLDEHFAYDDGTAERGVSLNGRGQRLAYRYRLEEPAHLTDISLHSPFYNRSAGGQEINLLVFSSLAGVDGATTDLLLYSQRVTLPDSVKGLNEFVTIPLASPQQLQAGDFYIGFEQLGNTPTNVGFDTNTNSQDRIYQSINGAEWRGGFDVAGSLMLRPYFRRDVTLDPNGLPDYHFPPLRLYPNPAHDRLWVESEAQQLRLYDAQGRLVLQQPASRRTELHTGPLQPGLYLLQLQYSYGIQSKRILIVR